jgi:hypothetical protein
MKGNERKFKLQTQGNERDGKKNQAGAKNYEVLKLARDPLTKLGRIADWWWAGSSPPPTRQNQQ